MARLSPLYNVFMAVSFFTAGTVFNAQAQVMSRTAETRHERKQSKSEKRTYQVVEDAKKYSAETGGIGIIVFEPARQVAGAASAKSKAEDLSQSLVRLRGGTSSKVFIVKDSAFAEPRWALTIDGTAVGFNSDFSEALIARELKQGLNHAEAMIVSRIFAGDDNPSVMANDYLPGLNSNGMAAAARMQKLVDLSKERHNLFVVVLQGGADSLWRSGERLARQDQNALHGRYGVRGAEIHVIDEAGANISGIYRAYIVGGEVFYDLKKYDPNVGAQENPDSAMVRAARAQRERELAPMVVPQVYDYRR